MDDGARATDPTHAETGSADTQVNTDRHGAATPLQLENYELKEVLGRGGMGEVIAATDLRIEREVAVKRMRGDAASDEAVTRFLREAKIQARLDHPAIVPVHELGTDAEGRPFFTMKRLAGITLLAQLDMGGPIQPMLRALVDVGFAIGLAHSRGIVHRDLKPANIMLGHHNEVYVLDWGVARVMQSERRSAVEIDSVSSPGMTAAGAMLGTPGYMAPEQMRGDDVGPAADVYSLGAILFEILAGEPLHPSGQRAIASTLAHPIASPLERRPERGVAPELDALCVEALAEDPTQRPTARQLAERIQQYLDGDRDLERRRANAARELAVAKQAYESGEPSRRRLAAQSAARALAFDPTSRAAADMVARIILEPPPEDPPDLQRIINDEEQQLAVERSRRAILAYLTIYLWLPFAPFTGIASWHELAALYGAATAMAVISWYNARTGRISMPVLMLGAFALVVTFSRLAGVFVLTPMLVCGLVVTLSSSGWFEERRWVLVAWAIASLVGPLLLEAAGLLEPTWRLLPNGQGLLTWGTIDHAHGVASLASLIFGQTALGAVVCVFALVMSRARRKFQVRALRQAWHLQQMLPRATSQAS
ncbi:MAG: serine/threonine-protein kinase [Acidobacteriota bacterium]